MQTFAGIADAADAARIFIISNRNTLPAHNGSASPDAPSVKSRLLALAGTGTSPVDLCAGFVKAVYANPDAFTPEAKNMAAGIADEFYQIGYHQRLDGRALGMRDALRRESGEAAPEGIAWPDPKTDPAPDAEYVKPPEPEEAAPSGDAPADTAAKP